MQPEAAEASLAIALARLGPGTIARRRAHVTDSITTVEGLLPELAVDANKRDGPRHVGLMLDLVRHTLRPLRWKSLAHVETHNGFARVQEQSYLLLAMRKGGEVEARHRHTLTEDVAEYFDLR